MLIALVFPASGFPSLWSISPTGKDPSSAWPNSMGRKSPYPDAEGIAEASGDENDEQQRATSRQKDRPKAVSVMVKFAQQPRSAVRPFGALRLLCGRRLTLHLLLSILG